MDLLVTARLIADRLDERDLPDLVALHFDPDVSRHLGGIRSGEATGAYLAANLAIGTTMASDSGSGARPTAPSWAAPGPGR